MRSRILMTAAAAAVIVGGGVGAGAALGRSTTPATTVTSSSPPAWLTSYSGYTAAMNGYGGMMSGYGGMMGGYRGTTGGYGGTDMGRIMGSVLANTAGPRVGAAQAAAEGAAVPAGLRADSAHHRLVVTGSAVTLTVVAGPAGGSMYDFEIAGMTNPTIVVPSGTHVTLRLINADGDMAHGLAVVPSGAASTWMPMMTAAEAFPGAGIWALGEATSRGAQTATTTFTAVVPGTYTYLCPVPGHAQQGMTGTLQVI
jgi:rusticyanin